jgi:hypothetical protein
MQKISSYLYSNRVQLLADVVALDAAYPVEWKIVYQRPVKIYKGVDNVITLDVKNADQKRINIFGKTIRVVVMDQTEKEINTYTATVLDDGSTVDALTGVATVTISESDLVNLEPQFLKFSVYMVNSDTTKTLLYGDSKYGSHGTIELLGGVIPKSRPVQTYDDFQQSTNYQGLTFADRIITYYSSAIPVKFYEGEATTSVTVEVSLTNFVGTVSVEATKSPVMGNEAFLSPAFVVSRIYDEANMSSDTEIATFVIDVTDYTYIRVKYVNSAGSVDSFQVIS